MKDCQIQDRRIEQSRRMGTYTAGLGFGMFPSLLPYPGPQPQWIKTVMGYIPSNIKPEFPLPDGWYGYR